MLTTMGAQLVKEAGQGLTPEQKTSLGLKYGLGVGGGALAGSLIGSALQQKYPKGSSLIPLATTTLGTLGGICLGRNWAGKEAREIAKEMREAKKRTTPNSESQQ